MEKNLKFKTVCNRCNGQMTLEQDVTSHKDVAIDYKYYQCFQCGKEQYLETDTKAVAVELLKSRITYTHKEIAIALDVPQDVIKKWAYHYA